MSGRSRAEAAAATNARYGEALEKESLGRVFSALAGGGARITPATLHGALKKLQYRCSRQDVQDMIWEVDEDLDGAVSWEEFECLFWRKRTDKSGWEPRRLFNVLEFMMYDKDSSGSIDLDECMEILYQRFGKEDLERRVEEFMSNDVDQDKSISLTEFLDMMKRSDAVATSEDPGSKLSAGILAATRAERALLMRRLGQNQAPLGSPRGRAGGKDASTQNLQGSQPSPSRPGTSLGGALKLK